jgi:hypothetical protein
MAEAELQVGVTAGFHVADVSEFQPNINWAQYVAENGGAAIVRAMYGSTHVDTSWLNGRRAAAHAGGVGLLGIYQYLRADQDAAAQAKTLMAQVGSLRQGEFLVCDLEEGSGSQLSRANAWLATANRLPAYPGYNGAWLYSGLNFAQTHGLSGLFSGTDHHTWVAAYQSGEPTLGHSLWQHSNGTLARCTYEPWAGMGFVDCSSKAGGLAEFQSLVYSSSIDGGGTTQGDTMESLKIGTGAQTIYSFPGGSAGGIAFGCNATDVGANAPYLAVASYNNQDHTWTRTRIRVPADTTQNDGQVSVDFPSNGDHINTVSVIRDSNGAADNVAVGVHLY